MPVSFPLHGIGNQLRRHLSQVVQYKVEGGQFANAVQRER